MASDAPNPDLSPKDRAIAGLLGLGWMPALVGLEIVFVEHKPGLTAYLLIIGGVLATILWTVWPPKKPWLRQAVTYIFWPLAKKRAMLGVILICVGVVLVYLEISSQGQAIRAYALPRTLTEQQIADFRQYLSASGSAEEINMKWLAGDAEAEGYAGQIASAFIGTPWKIRASMRIPANSEGMGLGLSIMEERAGQPEGNKKRPSEILQGAFQAAKIQINGGGGAWNRPQNSLSVVVGPRPAVNELTLRQQIGNYILRNWVMRSN